MAKAEEGAAPEVEGPRIRHLCSLGTLAGYGGKKGDWSAAEKLKKIRKAGFDGFRGRLHVASAEEVGKSGLIFACATDVGGPAEVEDKLTEIKEEAARCASVQLLDHTTRTAEAVTVARAVMACADKIGLDVSIEVRRDTCTETPEKTYALADGFEKAERRPLKLTWDFSGFAVLKHLSSPFWARLAERPDLMRLANQFHLRPFNGHHVQVPAVGKGGKRTPEFVDFMKFADRVLANWLAGAGPGREMFVCPEQIADGYWLSVFSDRFADAKVIRDRLVKSFKRHRRQWTPPANGHPKGT